MSPVRESLEDWQRAEFIILAPKLPEGLVKTMAGQCFLQKWHLSAADFMHETLQRGRAVDQAQIAGQIRKGGLRSRLKRMWDVFK